MSTVPATSSPGPLAVWSRYALVAVAWLFAAGGVVQVFLAGLGLFESASYWADHRDFGMMLGPLTYLMPVLALLGRVGAPRLAQSIVVPVLFVVQMLLPDADAGWVAALHPVNAFFLIGAAGSLGSRTLELLRPGAASSEGAASSAPANEGPSLHIE